MFRFLVNLADVRFSYSIVDNCFSRSNNPAFDFANLDHYKVAQTGFAILSENSAIAYSTLRNSL